MHRMWNALSRSTLSDARPLWLDAAQQTEAMRFCMSEPTQALGKKPECYDVDTDSDSGEEDDEEEDVEAEDD